MTPSANTKLAFNELARLWGERPRVFQHWDEGERNSIHVASLDDPSGFFDVTGVGTLGLSDHDLGMGPVRVELVGAFPRSFADAGNVAATCAFNAFKDRMPTRPDAVHPRVMELYRSDTPLPHVLLADPFLWDDEGPHTIRCDGFSIAWLMMVPIAESERLFALQHGPRALSYRLEIANADVLDLMRPAVA
jgi:hypothetical protein